MNTRKITLVALMVIALLGGGGCQKKVRETQIMPDAKFVMNSALLIYGNEANNFNVNNVAYNITDSMVIGGHTAEDFKWTFYTLKKQNKITQIEAEVTQLVNSFLATNIPGHWQSTDGRLDLYLWENGNMRLDGYFARPLRGSWSSNFNKNIHQISELTLYDETGYIKIAQTQLTIKDKMNTIPNPTPREGWDVLGKAVFIKVGKQVR